MRQFVSASAESSLIGPVDVARWEQYGLDATMPFRAMWYSMPPSSTAATDCHPEIELDIVVKGTASVEIDGRRTEVAQGAAFLLDSQEAHTIHNPSPDEELLVFAAYWMPLTTRAQG